MRTDEQTFSCILDHTTIEWGGGQLSGALVCEPPSWPDEFPRDSEGNETRMAHVGLDGKMNRPLRKVVKIVICPVSQVEREGRTDRRLWGSKCLPNGPQNS